MGEKQQVNVTVTGNEPPQTHEHGKSASRFDV